MAKKRSAETALLPPAPRQWTIPKLSDVLGDSAFELSYTTPPSSPSRSTGASSSSQRVTSGVSSVDSILPSTHQAVKKLPGKTGYKPSKKGKEKEVTENMEEDM